MGLYNNRNLMIYGPVDPKSGQYQPSKCPLSIKASLSVSEGHGCTEAESHTHRLMERTGDQSAGSRQLGSPELGLCELQSHKHKTGVHKATLYKSNF